MTRATRLCDGDDAELRELLRYAQAQGAPSAARVDALTARVMARLAASPAITPSTGTSSVVPWAIGTVVMMIISAGTYQLLTRAAVQKAEPIAAPAPPRAEAAQTTPAAPFVPQAAVPAPEARAQHTDEQPPSATQRHAIGRRSYGTRAAARSAGALALNPTAEVELLKRARLAIAADPKAALALLAQHQREHPAGIFAEEREALAVEALWRAGDAKRARHRLQTMLATYPRSTYRERLETLLAQ